MDQAIDPVGDAMNRAMRIARGGSYDFSDKQARSAMRGAYVPSVFNGSIGVRPGRAVDP